MNLQTLHVLFNWHQNDDLWLKPSFKSFLFTLQQMCLNGEEETSDSLESIEVSSSEESSPAVSPSQDPPPQDLITETPLPNVIQETEPPSLATNSWT